MTKGLEPGTPAPPRTIKSDFALLDVKSGSKALAKYFRKRRKATKSEGYGRKVAYA